MVHNGYKVTGIETATINGRKRKLFKLWEHIDGAWWHTGQFSAPMSVKNVDLAEYTRRQIEEI